MKENTNITEETTGSIHQIYDKTMKKILTLSPGAIINLINGLFHTEYPLDSSITYNWTEHHDDDLKRTLADTILTINGEHAYHIEAQMSKDEEIELTRDAIESCPTGAIALEEKKEEKNA